MINRDNWKAMQTYLDDLDQVAMLKPSTIDYCRSRLRHVLEWADKTPLGRATRLRPTLPRYLEGLDLSQSSIEHVLIETRKFFRWLRAENKRRYVTLDDRYLETLRCPPMPAVRAMDRNKNAYVVEEVRQLVTTPGDTLRHQRDQAAAAFLFLSGMRAWAFVTMPIMAVDLDQNEIRQWPELGVEPKGGKGITSYLLMAFPDLLDVVRSWDTLVRAALPQDALWYAPLSQPAGTDLCYMQAGQATKSRYVRLLKGIRYLCDLVGLSRKSPHKFRHGHALYGLRAAADVADMEAVSKNLGHSDLKVTLGTYSELDASEVKHRIESLRVTKSAF